MSTLSLIETAAAKQAELEAMLCRAIFITTTTPGQSKAIESFMQQRQHFQTAYELQDVEAMIEAIKKAHIYGRTVVLGLIQQTITVSTLGGQQ